MSAEIQLLLSLVLGAVIGLEREAYVKHANLKTDGRGSLGVRSFMIIAPLGCITALLYSAFQPLSVLLFVGFLVLLGAYYVVGSMLLKDNGLTTELAIFWTYIVGLLIGTGVLSTQAIIASVVCLVLILSSKQQIKEWVGGISQNELSSFIGFALVALVVFPFLPDQGYTVGEIPLLRTLAQSFAPLRQFLGLELINPFGIWKVVVLITGVELLGYMLKKLVGPRHGLAVASVAGGFVSSTSTTISLATQSKHAKNSNTLVGAAILANFSSFLQMFILIVSVAPSFLAASMPMLLSLSLGALAAAWFFLRKHTKDDSNEAVAESESSLFSLAPALKFAALFLVIKIMTKALLILFGEGGFIAGSMIAAVTGLDAVTINVAEASGSTISASLAVFTLIAANAVNLLAKSWYSYVQGSRAFALRFFTGVIVMIAASAVGYLIGLA